MPESKLRLRVSDFLRQIQMFNKFPLNIPNRKLGTWRAEEDAARTAKLQYGVAGKRDDNVKHMHREILYINIGGYRWWHRRISTLYGVYIKLKFSIESWHNDDIARD